MIAQALAIYKKLNVGNISSLSLDNPQTETSDESKTDGDTRINEVRINALSDPSERAFSLQSPPKGFS